MCGIVYSKSLVGNPVKDTIKKRFKDQRTRGTDGFGFYLPQRDRLTHNTREGRILNLLERTKDSEILFHHRLPTSTLNVRNACHPFSTKDWFENNYVLVHNGVIYNDETLRQQHEKLGIEYISKMDDGSFNDSEALAYDVARYLEGEVTELTARGSIAFVLIKRDKTGKPTHLFFGRNTGNPLKMKKTDYSLTLSSEGEGEMIQPNQLYDYNYDTGEITKRYMFIPGYSTTTTYYKKDKTYHGGFHDYGDYPNVNDDYSADKDYSEPFSDDDGELDDEYELFLDEKQRVNEVKHELLNDAYQNPWFAIELGEERLEKIQNNVKFIEDNNEIQELTPEDDELLDELVIEMFYLKEALKSLREDNESHSAFGFQAHRGGTK